MTWFNNFFILEMFYLKIHIRFKNCSKSFNVNQRFLILEFIFLFHGILNIFHFLRNCITRCLFFYFVLFWKKDFFKTSPFFKVCNAKVNETIQRLCALKFFCAPTSLKKMFSNKKWLRSKLVWLNTKYKTARCLVCYFLYKFWKKIQKTGVP